MHLTGRSWGLLLALLVTRFGGINAQDISTLPACGQSCVNDIMAESSTLGCDSGDTACLCAKPDFQFGISDCAKQACGADLAPSVTDYASSLCASATQGATQPAATQDPATSSDAPPPTTSSQAPATTSDPAATTTSSPETAAAESTSAPPASTEASSPTGSTQQPSEPTSTTSPSTEATGSGSDSAAAASTDTPSSSTNAQSLTAATKIGIGIGAAAAAASVIAVAVFLVIRHRRRKAQRSTTYLKSLQISDPLPGAGRTYANDRFNKQYEKDFADLESRSRRYEDMAELERPRRVL